MNGYPDFVQFAQMRRYPRSYRSREQSGNHANDSSIFPLCVVAVLATLQGAATLVAPRGFYLTLITDSLAFLLMASAALVFLRNRSYSAGPVRLFWTLFAACWVIRVVVQLAWMYYDVILRQEVPDPFFGDVLLFLSNIPVLAALMLQAQGQWREKIRALGLIDFTMLLVWWLYLYLYFVMPWEYVLYDDQRSGINYNRLNGLVDITLLAIAIFLATHSSARWKWFYGSFFGAQLFIALSGYISNRAIVNHTYYPGSTYDVPYTAALAMFTVVGLIGGSLANESPGIDIEGPFPLMKWGMLSLLSLPVITTLTALTQTPPLRVARFREVVGQGTILVMAGLLLLRQRRMMSELTENARVLHDASVTDLLTGCRNRRFLAAALPADADQAIRLYSSDYKGHFRDLVFYLIDLDNFKEVNDRYGHSVGDRVLVEISGRIKSAIRNSDVLVRWGGDEFLVVTRNSDRADAAIFASRLLKAVRDPITSIELDLAEVTQTCSIGWAAFPWYRDRPSEIGFEAVLAFADRALYDAKSSGKNRAVGISASGGSDITFTTVTSSEEKLGYSAEAALQKGQRTQRSSQTLT